MDFCPKHGTAMDSCCDCVTEWTEDNATLIPAAMALEIKAQAIEEAAKEVRDKFPYWGRTQIWLNEYAQELRQKAATNQRPNEEE